MNRLLFAALVFASSGCNPEREPFDLPCGDLVCEGSTEACWDDCASMDDETHSCLPIDKSREECSGTPSTGYRCSFICG